MVKKKIEGGQRPVAATAATKLWAILERDDRKRAIDILYIV